MKAIRQALILLLISAMLGGVTRLIMQPVPRMEGVQRDENTLTLEAAEQLTAPVRWIDARGKSAYDENHIPNALLLNEDAWEQLLPNLLAVYSPDSVLIVYCDSSHCDASRQVAKRLRDEVGLKNVYTLEGGWQAWKARADAKR